MTDQELRESAKARMIEQMQKTTRSLAAMEQGIHWIQPLVSSGEGKLLLALHRRLLETLAFGEPKTKLPTGSQT